MALLKESLNFLNFLPSHTRGQRFLAFTRPPDVWRCQVGTSAENEYVCICLCQTKINIIVLFVETPRKFITAKLSIRKPRSSSVLIICDLFNSHALFIYKSVVICWLASFENLIKRHINHVISNVVK